MGKSATHSPLQTQLIPVSMIPLAENELEIKKLPSDISKKSTDRYHIHSRRYIGNKFKLTDWIFSIVDKECTGKTFADLFAGTGAVASKANHLYDEVIINDFLYSNHAIYQAFFGEEEWDDKKIRELIKGFNRLKPGDLKDNYFSTHFGGKYFSHDTAKIVGHIREAIEGMKQTLTNKEYNILLASLIYSIDKIANTVGHYDAYFKKDHVSDIFVMKPISPLNKGRVKIYREDSNSLAKNITADIVYIDPPYNSRQYSRFYHLLETLIKWDKPRLHGVALKPDPENVSEYSKTSARDTFEDLIRSIKAKYIVVSYNNTYNPKSSSSKNKITLEQLREILESKGKTKVFEKKYRHFTTGKTEFDDHKEYLFITKA